MEYGFNCWGVRGPALVNVSEMHTRFYLSSQPLTILAPWVLLLFRWSIHLVL